MRTIRFCPFFLCCLFNSGCPKHLYAALRTPILLPMYKYLLTLHKIAHCICYTIPISIQQLHTTIKNLVTYTPFMTPSITHQAPFLWKRDKAMGGPLIHCPSAPHKAILLNYSQQTKTTHVRSFICCSIRFVSLSPFTHTHTRLQINIQSLASYKRYQ